MKNTELVKTEIGQLEMELKTVRYLEVDGIAMGVLDDGTPYLTARGLARLCGAAPSTIIELGLNWDEEQAKPRGKKILSMLKHQGFSREGLYIKTSLNGQPVSAYTDDVCMVILEYYAFDAGRNIIPDAQRNYRILARQTLRTFIYKGVGYDPKNQIPDSWKHYHDRVLLNDLPQGYFSVFREIADIVIYAIQTGLIVDTHVVPDISIGRKWSQHWKENNFDQVYGERQRFPHSYPDYFPQAKSNPQDIFIYPLEALGEFRIWMQEHYLPENFPTYLKKKVKGGYLPASNVELLLEAVEQKPKAITG